MSEQVGGIAEGGLFGTNTANKQIKFHDQGQSQQGGWWKQQSKLEEVKRGSQDAEEQTMESLQTVFLLQLKQDEDERRDNVDSS